MGLRYKVEKAIHNRRREREYTMLAFRNPLSLLKSIHEKNAIAPN